MIEILSIVAFDNKKRHGYIDASIGSFQRFNPGKYRHIVIDGSATAGEQGQIFARYSCEYYHQPGPYCQRLKTGLSKISSDYLLFFPDDYRWIFDFPIEKAVAECRRAKIDELKLACRGMTWFAQENPIPTAWHKDGRVISGERLRRDGDLFVSHRHFTRNFHEQFSLGCHLIRTDFLRSVVHSIPDNVVSPGAVEKRAYLRLIFKRYRTAYYKMWIPAFHFIDKTVEGPHQWHKADDMLIERNIPLYNSLFNIPERN